MPPNDAVLFYAVLKGNARIAGITGGAIDLVPGDVAIILSGEAHALRNKANSPVRVLEFLRSNEHVDVPPTITIGSTGRLSARILCGRLSAGWPAGLRRTSMPAIVRVGGDTFGTANSAVRVDSLQMMAIGSGASAVLTRHAALMLTLSLRNHPQCPLLFRLSASDPIAQALQFIASNPAADWSVARLAQKVRLGRSTFAARFAAEIGRTPMDVVTERRMQQAAELLRQGELKIADVSARVGYRSEASFSRRFTSYFGLSPGQMRRNSQVRETADPQHTPWHELLAAGRAWQTRMSGRTG